MGTGPINWLSQLREEPKDHSINDMNGAARDFTVFEIPTELHQMTPACFELFGLQLGLQHRSLQKSGVQRLKLQLARILDVKLKEDHASSWDAWVNLIVPHPEHAQKLYENPSGCTDPAVVQYQLALDSLFVVAFFQHKAGHDALDEFRDLFNTQRFQFGKLQSDFLQVQNQVPMEILKAMTMQLCDIHKMMPEIRETHPEITHQEVARRMLDVVLKKAIIYLHPFAFPDRAGGFVRWCFRGVENDVNNRWFSYLDKNYPATSADVDLLRKHGVLYSFESNEDVLQIWNKTSKGLSIFLSSKAWKECFEAIHRHQKSKWKQWRAEGWSRFCSKPWLFISLVGALVLLFLTFVQTWISVVNAPLTKWHFNWS
ncbi:unnamed protein product [Sphagnum jensenii]|uniref:Uncharacterized protein n=1 Tax=Sphagnum jensenii TaxID=128206 RepID=A0ABP0WZP5_9BRYO